MKIAFIDYKHKIDGFANRDQTGSFGSQMNSDGLLGKVISRLKKNKLVLPNLTLATLMSLAEENGHVSSYYNSGNIKNEDIVIIASSMVQHRNEIELAKSIKEKFPNTLVGFINAFSSVKPEIFINDCDFIFLGEPENAFVRACKGEIAFEGLINEEGKFDVNNLPVPLWEKTNIHDFGYFPALKKKPFLTIQGSRGCPFGCDFCPYLVQQGIPLRRRTNDHVLKEILTLKSKFGVRSLLFRDITFSFDVKGTKGLLRSIADANLGIEFGAETRIDRIDDEMIELFRKANFKVLNLGIESVDPKILKSNGRVPIKNGRIEDVVEKLHENGIKVQAFYILGLEHDTIESVEATIAYSKKLNTFSAQYCLLTPFPGTKTMDKLPLDSLLTQDYSKFTEYDPVVKLDNITTDEIIHLKNKAYSSYYFRPSWFLKHGLRLAFENLLHFKFRKPKNRPRVHLDFGKS